MTDFLPGSFWAELQKYPLFTVEAELCALMVLFFLSRGGMRPLQTRFREWFGGNAGSPLRDVLIIGIIAIALHASALPFLHPPCPGVHDEFSFLLMADTFSSGRLTNPPHPLAVFFESFHIIQQPTYASMYPPAQGVALAAGQLLGHPILGVWIGAALLCASLTWMLQAWVPRRWAFLGGLIAVIRIGVFSYWANTYWGGSIPAIGGCLAWGGLGRILRRPQISSSIWLALGLIILATSRPYEGLWMSLPIMAALGWVINKRRAEFRAVLLTTVLPLTCVLIVGGVAIAYYNWRVFGSPLTMPYSVNRQLYSVAPNFIWGSDRPAPEYNHAVMKDFYTRIETSGFQSDRTFYNYLLLTRLKLFTIWAFFLGPALIFPLLVSLIALWRRNSRIRWLAAGIAAMLFGIALIAWPTNPHYYAPFTCCLYGLLIDGFRRIYVWRGKGRTSGLKVVVGLVSVCLLMLAFRASSDALNVRQVNNVTPIPWHAAELFPLLDRRLIVENLRSVGGKHLVVVRYSLGHSPFKEYVYNPANIDSADIVWARELENPSANLPLVKYFTDRRLWLFKPDEGGTFEPYPVYQLIGGTHINP
jgi:hypothetical protein